MLTLILVVGVGWIAYRQCQLSVAYANLARLVRTHVGDAPPEANECERLAFAGELVQHGLVTTGLGWLYSAGIACAAAYRWWRAKR